MYKLEHNVETGEIKQVELTAQEITEIEAQYANQKIKSDAAQAEAESKAAAKAALLNKLGITAEEAQLLLGGK